MYQVYCDDKLLYDSRLASLKIISPKADLELNKTGSFVFTVYPDHIYYSFIKKMKSIVTVFQDSFCIFRGRVLNDEVGFYNEKQVYCEGELAFLLDTVQRPYDYSGTLSAFFAQIIAAHNAQVDAAHQFKVGKVTVTDTNDYIHYSDTTYLNTWETLQKKLIDTHGGFMWVRHEADGNYIDYVQDFNTLSTQSIKFGQNLIDLKRKSKGEDIITAVIPLGEKPEGSDYRLNIKGVNGGRDFVYDQEAVDEYGWIFKPEIWEDVTLADNLKRKAEDFLAEQKEMFYELELSAADLAMVDSDFNSFHLGSYVTIESKPHFGSTIQRHLIKKLSISLLEPMNNTLTIGVLQTGLMDNVTHDNELIYQNIIGDVTEIIGNATGGLADGILQEVESSISSTIDQKAGEIILKVSEDYYLKADATKLVQSISTQFTQTEKDFEFKFNKFEQDLETIAGQNPEFTEIIKYIRFVDGNIILGQSDSPLTLKIEHDRIAFINSFHEVAYFSNDKLFVTDGEFLNSLKLGNFAFAPRQNGNLSFSKIV